jgi:zinc D-Ala-D-Ala carboxypeptidase
MANQLLDLIKQLLLSFLSNGVEGKVEASVSIPLEVPKEEVKEEPVEIDWTNLEAKISKHFTVKEACWLPSWQVMHNPSENEKANILKQAAKMDLIRDFLGVPINVHCWIRPVLNNPSSIHHGQDYNALVKGAKNSSHKVGLATDYDAQGLNCDDVRASLVSKLDVWDIRMEKMPGSNWVHNDCSPVITYRYFNP